MLRNDSTLKKIKGFIERKKIEFTVISLYFIYLITTVLINNSLIFSFNILNKYGDQYLYISLANNIINGNLVQHVYSVGYSIFLIPFILILKTFDWTVLTRYVVFIQSFIFMPLIILMVVSLLKKLSINFSSKLKKSLILLTGLFLFYELFTLTKSEDDIVYFVFFGFIPYSEILAVLLAITVYFIVINERFFSKKYPLPVHFVLGIAASYLVSIRIMMLIILLPIFVHWCFLLIEKKFKQSSLIFIGALLAYLPQLYYNYKAYNNPFMVGYNLNWTIIKHQYTEISMITYGKKPEGQFEISYLLKNLSSLFFHYIHFLLISLFAIFVLIKNNILMKKEGFFLLSLNISFIIYMAVYLSYWWSNIQDCIDRFLLPLFFISIINLYLAFYLKNNKIKNASSKKSIQK